MQKWILLVTAICIEVSGSLCLKASLSHPAWYLGTVVAYAISFVLLARILRMGMPLGVAYGIWGAGGVALTAVFSWAVYGEPLTPVMMMGLVLIIGGILCVQLGSQRALARQAAVL